MVEARRDERSDLKGDEGTKTDSKAVNINGKYSICQGTNTLGLSCNDPRPAGRPCLLTYSAMALI